MSHPQHPDDLVTAVAVETEFQAGILVSVLQDAGIEAFAFGAVPAVYPLGKQITPVLVQVRQVDLERAQAVLKQNQADSVDLDWDQVDVGERVDDLPLTAREGMPALARIGFALVVVLILLGLLWMLASSLRLLP